MPVDEQHFGRGICAGCFDSTEQCDLDAVSSNPHDNSGCIECAQSGRYCHIPVSDAPWIQIGLNTATQGKRQCLNCAVNGTSCRFPGGQRPNPCHSCIRKGSGFCKLPPVLLTDFFLQNEITNGSNDFDYSYGGVDSVIPDLNTPYETYTVLVASETSDLEVGSMNPTANHQLIEGNWLYPGESGEQASGTSTTMWADGCTDIHECPSLKVEFESEPPSELQGPPETTEQFEFSAATMAGDLIHAFTPFPIPDSPRVAEFEGDFMVEPHADWMSEQQHDRNTENDDPWF